MIWLWLAVVAAASLAPLVWFAWSGGLLRGRRDAALALHRAQLDELDRDLAEGRLIPGEHVAARLEVQRRLLAEAEQTEAASSSSGPAGIVCLSVLVPALALVLYVTAGGAPNYAALRDAAQQQGQLAAQNASQDEAVIGRLRATLATMDPHTDAARRGYVMLGQAEISLGHLQAAAAAWRKALAQRFDPMLGAETAEVISQAEAHVTPEAAGLFRRALAEAPPDAVWRKQVEKRLTEAGGL